VPHDLTPRRPLLAVRAPPPSLVDDTFRALADDERAGGDVVVSRARLTRAGSAAALRQELGCARVGVALSPGDDVRALPLEDLSLIVLLFPKHTEGRPYSQARILRDERGYRGALRATGAVLRDHLPLLSRCGFDEFELRDPAEAPDAWRALQAFSVRLQGATDGPPTARADGRTDVRPLFPLFLKLDGARCLVVGGGPIAAHKAAELSACGAQLTVVSPAFHAAFDEPALAGAVRVRRPFQPGDSAGARVVVAATGDAAVDAQVAADARAHHALVNAVDNVALSMFFTGGVVRRGPLTVAVGTSGASPALARKVRSMLEDLLPTGLTALARALGAARPALLQTLPVFEERARLMDLFVERALHRLSTSDGPPADERTVAGWIEAELLLEAGRATDAGDGSGGKP
jgi:siroheme synthase-like protein